MYRKKVAPIHRKIFWRKLYLSTCYILLRISAVPCDRIVNVTRLFEDVKKQKSILSSGYSAARMNGIVIDTYCKERKNLSGACMEDGT